MDQASIKVVEELTRSGRKLRNPIHNWQVRAKPWVIQPLCIAPVLPGETLKNILVQARIVTDPIQNGLIGWWTEQHWFYVKLRDLPQAVADAYIQLMITPGSAMTAAHTATKVDTYHGYATSVDSTLQALIAVVNRFFRDEDEAWDTAGSTLGNMPLASLTRRNGQPGWMDSVIDTTALPDGGLLPGGTANPTVEQTNDALNTYTYLREMKFIDMTFEDYCRSFGVRIPTADEVNNPELLRTISDWSYPVNHVEPTTGVPSAAVSWALKERVDKDRFFREPGFVFGVSVTRPKVYFANQRSSMTDFLDTPFSWLPALMGDRPETSLREFTNVNGPITGATNGYWVDLRDLFLYGDQFVNFGMAAADDNSVALPTAAMNKRYVSAADVDSLFKNAAGGFNLVRQDGTARLSILGRQIDYT